jgi:hypothetical protein
MKRFQMIFAAPLAFSLAGLFTTHLLAGTAYEFAYVPATTVGNPLFFRITVSTGQVFSVGNKLIVVTEAVPIPPGDYHLYPVVSPKDGSYWIYRMDSQSGRVWFFSNNTFTEAK